MERPAVMGLDDPAIEILGSVLANETGRRVLAALASGPKSPSDIARELGLPLTTVKHHVDRLVSAGIVQLVETSPGRKGRKRIYALRSPALVIIPSSSEGAAIRAIRGWVMERASAVISLRRPILAGVLAAIVVGIGSGLLATHAFLAAPPPMPSVQAGVSAKGVPAATSEVPPSPTEPLYQTPEEKAGLDELATPRGASGGELTAIAVAVVCSSAAGAAVFWAATRSRLEVGRKGVAPAVNDPSVPPDEVGAGVAEDE